MEYILSFYTITLVLNLLIVIGVSVRVIMKRPSPGTAICWLFIVASFPFVGFILYLLIGDRRLELRRIQRFDTLHADFKRISKMIPKDLIDVDWPRHPTSAQAMNRLGHRMTGYPTVQGSRFKMFSNTDEILEAIAGDVDQAKHSVLMEFYIWNLGGKADDVLDAVIRAAQRGVQCRLLIDCLGANAWWKSDQPQKLRKAGVELCRALPVGLFRMLTSRNDLRMHRKIVVIDSQIAWTGSMNMVDPAFFKQDGGFGRWIDAMARLQGSVVVPLAATMLGDWAIETGESIEDLIKSTQVSNVRPNGTTDIQVVPSGPGQTDDGLLQMLLTMIHAAQKELVLTTPYLVPDDSLLKALRGAAARGVRVMLIVPKKVDSLMTRYASRSYYEDLMDIGVEIWLHTGGLLHTKSITIDDSISMFGTVNLDMRSLWLNYEVSLFVYGQEFTQQLRALQQTYIDCAEQLDSAAWTQRPFAVKLIENTLHLMSPLL
jgi:cardiolipin synthase